MSIKHVVFLLLNYVIWFINFNWKSSHLISKLDLYKSICEKSFNITNVTLLEFDPLTYVEFLLRLWRHYKNIFYENVGMLKIYKFFFFFHINIKIKCWKCILETYVKTFTCKSWKIKDIVLVFLWFAFLKSLYNNNEYMQTFLIHQSKTIVQRQLIKII